MLDLLAHRGPDGEGLEVFWHPPTGPVADSAGLMPDRASRGGAASVCVLGHRRLSIIDLSDGARQPMATPDGRYHITYNGEIYNYLELRDELLRHHVFRTASDTEVLLAAYAHWGPGMLARLDGMFAFVILDRARGQLFAARDPIGIKPLYYVHEPERFLFASEPVALMAGRGGPLALDQAHAAEFLLFGVSDHDEGTLFDGVRQLPGGHSLGLDLVTGQRSIEPYWSPPPINLQPDMDLPGRFFETASLAIARQLRSDVPLGSSLSGGIDSGCIVALAGRALGPRASDYTTLTFSFPGFPDDESEFARAVAQRAGMQWHAVVPDLSRLADDLDQMILRMAEPFTTLSMFAQYKVMERARDLGLKVMLDGQGGDEVYMGYSRVAEGVMMQHLSQGRPGAFLREWLGMRRNHSVPLWRSLGGRWYFNDARIVTARARRRLTRYVDRDFLAHARPEVAQDRFGPKPAEQKQLDELRKYCLPRLLRFADRNSMAFGVEQRVPHLSNLILDLALSAPVTQRVVNGWTKHYVRQSLRGWIPDEVLWSRVKRGFDIPQSAWVRHLAPRIENWVGDLPASAPFKRSAILQDLRDPKRNGAPWYWCVLSTIAMVQRLGVKV